VTLPPFSAEQARWFRMARSGLVEPFASAEECAGALVGVQAQILPAAGLALWNRTPRLTNQRFEELLYTHRTLVKLWGQRNTLHLFASSDWPLLHAARTINRTWWERSAENGRAEFADHRHLVEEVAALLRERKTMGRSDLRASGIDLHDELYSSWGGIFADLVRLGFACHAGRVGSEGRFAHRERWLPHLEWNPPDPETANVEIMRRFFAAYGPATLHDFAYWRGVTMEDTRRWRAVLSSELCDVLVDGTTMLLRGDDLERAMKAPPPASKWPVRMVYRFDPYLLAHRDKSWVVDEEFYARVWRPAGHIEGVVLAHGRAVAVWRYDRSDTGLAITVVPFKPLTKRVLTAVERNARQVAGFFELPLVSFSAESEAAHAS
jgi:hypothetical protein